MKGGGYDDAYRACTCFWGRKPGSLVAKLARRLGNLGGLRVLDAGCGEGKNAHYLAMRGAKVLAVDVSRLALGNAQAAWPSSTADIEWKRQDIRRRRLVRESVDVVILYGVLHCLRNSREVNSVIRRLQVATVPGGYHVVCAFNDRRQDLAAHQDLSPVLLPHRFYLSLYRGWKLVEVSDRDLWETHPHNNIRHVHSMTRFIAKKGCAT